MSIHKISTKDMSHEDWLQQRSITPGGPMPSEDAIAALQMLREVLA